MKALLTIPQVAERLGCRAGLVRRLIGDGRLPASKIGRWRVDPDDLEAFIAKSKHQPPAAIEPREQAVTSAVPLCQDNPFL